MFYTKYDPPSTLWYIYNSNRKDGGAFGSYRKKEEADKEVVRLNDCYIWDDNLYLLAKLN